MKFLLKISTFEMALFFRQLSTLISAGIPLHQCIDSLYLTQENHYLKKIILSIKFDLDVGHSFSKAIQKFPNCFDLFSCQLIMLGEKSGTLEPMLIRIAHHQEKYDELKNKLKQILFYPCLMLLMSLSLLTIMLVFVVPQFSLLFASTHKALPYMTLLVISFSQFLRHYFLPTLLTIIFLILLTFILHDKLKPFYDKLIFQIPYLSHLFKKLLLIRFLAAASTLLATHLTITESFKLLASLSHNQLFRQTIQKVERGILLGLPLHQALQHSFLFTPLVINMVKIGEETGMVDKMLEKVANIYQTEFDIKIKQLTTLLEPLIITLLGVLIGFVVIAMYLPIFKMGTVI